MLFSASYLSPGTSAFMQSTTYPLTATECKLVFYYHMAGIDMGRLYVSIRSTQSDDMFEEVWSMEGHQSSKWQRAEVRRRFLYEVEVLYLDIPGICCQLKGKIVYPSLIIYWSLNHSIPRYL